MINTGTWSRSGKHVASEPTDGPLPFPYLTSSASSDGFKQRIKQINGIRLNKSSQRNEKDGAGRPAGGQGGGVGGWPVAPCWVLTWELDVNLVTS